jgi:hypothetical protein
MVSGWQGQAKAGSIRYAGGGTKHTLTPEQFREIGRGYLSKLVTDYPSGSYQAGRGRIACTSVALLKRS